MCSTSLKNTHRTPLERISAENRIRNDFGLENKVLNRGVVLILGDLNSEILLYIALVYFLCYMGCC